MRYVYDHDLHIHSGLSRCSRDPEQTGERILQYARELGLSTVCLTDHYWDSAVEGASGWYSTQNYDHLAEALPLPQVEGIRFLFGCETDLNWELRLGIPPARYDDFDFIIIPTTHMHMSGFTVLPEDMETPEKRATLWVRRLDAVLSMDLPFHKVGLAHLSTGLICRGDRAGFLATLDAIPEGEMERLFAGAATLGAGIELNMTGMGFAEEETDTILRMYRIAKERGCKFYLGTDAHHPAEFEKAKERFERAIHLLDLSEDDKFIL